MGKRHPKISKELETQIMDLFWDRTQTHGGKGQYDNRDKTIANKLGISVSIVSDTIVHNLDLHFERIRTRK